MLSDAGFLFTVMIHDFLCNRFQILRAGRFERDVRDAVGELAGRPSQAQPASQPLRDPGQAACLSHAVSSSENALSQPPAARGVV